MNGKHLIRQVWEHEDGSLQVYVGTAFPNVHTHVRNPFDISELRESFGLSGDLYMEVPFENLCTCTD